MSKVVTLMRRSLPFVCLAVCLPLALAGCSKGGGSATLPLPSVAATSTVPTPTYPVSLTDPRLAIFTALNNYRLKLVEASAAGVGAVAQDTTLDLAAQKHADYLTYSQASPIETHVETSTASSYFYADTPLDRALLAGYTPTNAFIGEAIGDVNNCVGQLLDTVYHLQELTSPFEKVGIGYTSTWVCVLLGGENTGMSDIGAATIYVGVPVGGGQEMGMSDMAVSPYNGEPGVPVAMSTGENPQPVPAYTNPGHPVMLRMRAEFASDALHVKAFTLSPVSGGPVAGTILVSPGAAIGSSAVVTADSNILPCVTFFVPAQPLLAGTTYTAQFTGDRNGVAETLTWSFTTTP